MGKIVQVNAGFTAVLLPDGKRYDGGGSTTLSDAEYAALNAATLRAITVTNASVPDPTRSNTQYPSSLTDAVTRAVAYTDGVINTQTANYNMTGNDTCVIANGAAVTISLPDPTTIANAKRFRVKNVNAASATVNSQGTSKTIDGAASQTLAQWAKAAYISDGTQWLTI